MTESCFMQNKKNFRVDDKIICSRRNHENSLLEIEHRSRREINNNGPNLKDL